MSQNEIQDDTIRILGDATNDSELPMFFIGPYGRRVSFYSQQKRALNTVWALNKTKVTSDGELRFPEGSTVAVIGGGIAGLMSATALTARKFLVTLFEKNSEELEFQRTSEHRFIHPTINFWPESDIEPTTELPFMDWHSDTCDGVIKQIREDWAKHFSELVVNCFTDTLVTDVRRSTGSTKMIVDSRPTDNEDPAGVVSNEFDFVVVASGFGEERSIQGARVDNYWVDNKLVNSASKEAEVFVSGIGDGGLIDALRLIHGDFDNGKYCIEIAKALSARGVDRNIAKIESGAKILRDQPLEYAIHCAAEYEKIVKNLPRKYRDNLMESIQKMTQKLGDSGKRVVNLIGRAPAPFQYGAAPIHKFLIAHALHANAINYIPGSVSDELILTPNGGDSINLKEKLVVIRHGAVSPLKFALRSDTEIEELKVRQKNSPDSVDLKIRQSEYWTENLYDYDLEYPAWKTDDLKFAKHRGTAAIYFMSKEHGKVISPKLDQDNGKAFFSLAREDGATMANSSIPKKLFGVQVKLEALPELGGARFE